MSDTIDRQTAIDALHDEIVRRRIDEDTNDDGTLDEFDTEVILRQLPSSQLPIKDKCCFCPHCDNCDVNDDGTLSAQPERKTGDCIYRQDAIDAIDEIESEVADGYGFQYEKWREYFTELPPAQTESISEEYAKAVRNWLVNYQVKCAELQGRYTPYEVLGWIVSDWRKDNGIW